LAESYIQATSSTAGAAAEGAADRKKLKYIYIHIYMATRPATSYDVM